MKSIGSFSLLLLISVLWPADLTARTGPRPTAPVRPRAAQAVESYKAELDLSFDFSLPGDTDRIQFTVALPRTMADRQKILSMEYSPRPSRIFTENGNRYAQFVFSEPKKPFKVKLSIKAELFRYDLSTARRKQQKNSSGNVDFTEFLKQEKYIEKDDARIQEIAKGIEAQSELSTVKKIYGYVLDNMEYAIHNEKDLGAAYAAQHKKGDCSEYSDLFVALCRAKNIPARIVTGYTVRFDDVSPRHIWVEVYLKDYGWVPFDPTVGDMDNIVFRNRVFDTLRPIYIYLTHLRNDQVIDNHCYAAWRYWGDDIKVEDSIDFKKDANPTRQGPKASSSRKTARR